MPVAVPPAKANGRPIQSLRMPLGHRPIGAAAHPVVALRFEPRLRTGRFGLPFSIQASGREVELRSGPPATAVDASSREFIPLCASSVVTSASAAAEFSQVRQSFLWSNPILKGIGL